MTTHSLLITGAGGFIGKPLAERAYRDGWAVKRALRQTQDPACIAIGQIGAATDWSTALVDIEVVVHLAARVHVMDSKEANSLEKYREVNTEGTLNLARHAISAGVRRFVYLSSIKVNGEASLAGVPFSANSLPAPTDPYGVSKLEAERGLIELTKRGEMEVVIIRPPLVYGPGVKGNFKAMVNWIARGLPLPLASVTTNRRSLVALDNLIDLTITCLDHPLAANQVLLVSDGEDLSTADLLTRLAHVMGRREHLLPIPVWLLKMVAVTLGKRPIIDRLCSSLQVDISKTQSLLDWTPPVSVDEGLSLAIKTATDTQEASS